MRIAVLAVVLVLVPRVGVGELNSHRDEVRRCLETTAAAASREDLNTYIECFDARLRPHIRKTAGLRYAQFEVGVSIEDCHVLSSTETSCDVAVSIASASRSFAAICSDLCSFRRLGASHSLLPRRGVDLHTAWFGISSADHPHPLPECEPCIVT